MVTFAVKWVLVRNCLQLLQTSLDNKFLARFVIQINTSFCYVHRKYNQVLYFYACSTVNLSNAKVYKITCCLFSLILLNQTNVMCLPQS